MIRVFKAKGVAKDNANKRIDISVKVNFQWLTKEEAQKRVETIKNRIHNVLMCDFNVSEITIE